jgi:3',5'-cyclic AMP phosphodiesterase CpdA
VNRRRFLISALPAASLAGAAGSVFAADTAPHFSFIHFTDLHIQPELHAGAGCAKCVVKMNSLKPDFAICGGDLVFDANEQGYPRAKQLYDLYEETLKPLQTRVHTVVGNHDVFGVSTKSGVAQSDPHYGKRMFEDRIGKTFSSFDYQGWHFVMLDSIGSRPGQDFIGLIDEAQVEWLKSDLAHMKPGTPLVVVTHVPLASAVMQTVADSWKTPETYLVTNAREVLNILWPYHPKMVLQGHTHIRENVVYNGCQFITSGAVCGNWWKGPREGHPEGFGVLTVRGDRIDWRYETYGFVADPA